MRVYAYIDGESHYERSADLWKKLHGNTASLSDAQLPRADSSGGSSFPDVKKPYLRVIKTCKFFWDTCYPFLAPNPFWGKELERAVYFTSITGDAAFHHNACVELRRQRFEPQIVQEVKALADRRRNISSAYNILEKPKGVDIGLSARILEDAYHNNFDTCLFFTSDIDFLPVIRVVRRLGKHVVLFGYADGMGNRSELEYVPDAFVDLSDRMKKQYQHLSDPPSPSA